MREISPNIHIETAYAGVTLGALSWSHGLILIDSPFKPDDIRTWRSSLLNLGGGIDRLLITLDAHVDRTLGARGMECSIIAQEDVNDVFRSKPMTFKPQYNQTGAAWEQFDSFGSIRWAPPEITFSKQMQIHWDHSPLILEHKPGPSIGSIWVTIPTPQILFIGDAVTINQPPFFEMSDIPAWIKTLEELLSPQYREYVLVCGRGGIVVHNQVSQQVKFLKKTLRSLETLAKRQSPAEKTAMLVPKLLDEFDFPAKLRSQYENRLQYGLFQYYARTYFPPSNDYALL